MKVIQVEINNYIELIKRNHEGSAQIIIGKKNTSSDTLNEVTYFNFDKTLPMIRDKK